MVCFIAPVGASTEIGRVSVSSTLLLQFPEEGDHTLTIHSVIIQRLYEFFMAGAVMLLLTMSVIYGNGGHSWDRQFRGQSILAHCEVRSGSPAVAIATADNLELGKMSGKSHN